MTFDAHKNLAVSRVATAPSPANSGTSLSVQTGHGLRFPTPPFNATVCPYDQEPVPENTEFVRVTARTDDTVTIVRAQEGSIARSIQVDDRIYAGITAKSLTDIEGEFASYSAPVARVGMSAAVARNNVDQALSAAIAWNVEHEDTDLQHDNTTNNTRLTCVKPGLYDVDVSLEFATNDTGYRALLVIKNGDVAQIPLAVRHESGPTSATVVSASGLVRLLANDYLEVLPVQSSGGALNVGGTGQFNHFAWCWLRS